jgi:hypothetical protein
MPSDETAGPRLANWLIGSATIFLLLTLVVPSLGDAQTESRANTCLDHAKILCLGLNQFEQNKLSFPLASTAPITARPGSRDRSDKRAGLSWLAMLLPYIEQQPIYTKLRESSNKFELSPFDAAVRMKPGGPLVASQTVESFRCPDFGGKPYVEVNESDYAADKTTGLAPAVTNYFALSSTHFIQNDGGNWILDSKPDAVLQGNGVLPMIGPKGVEMGWQKVKGASHAGISRDGTSHTIMFCEGRERGYAAWIDGQSIWTVAAWPDNEVQPSLIYNPNHFSQKVLGWPAAASEANDVCIARQAFGVPDEQAGVYLSAKRWSGSKPRKFGPSPNHPEGTVHGFGDGHGKVIRGEIDRNVYLHLVTRNGREVIPGTYY